MSNKNQVGSSSFTLDRYRNLAFSGIRRFVNLAFLGTKTIEVRKLKTIDVYFGKCLVPEPNEEYNLLEFLNVTA